MSNYESPFFTIPRRIMRLEKITISYILVYEAIFQFWHHDKPCFLSNKMICEKTGIASVSTVKDALSFFEHHGEIERITKNNKRYLVQPVKIVEVEDNEKEKGSGHSDQTSEKSVDNFVKNCTNNSQGAATSAGGGRYVGWGGAATSAHNKNNLIKQNKEKLLYMENEHKMNKPVDKFDNAKKHAFADSMNKNAREYKYIEKHEKIKKTRMPEELRNKITKMMGYTQKEMQSDRINVAIPSLSQPLQAAWQNDTDKNGQAVSTAS